MGLSAGQLCQQTDRGNGIGGGCSDSCLGRFGSGFIECICCPDPCYEGSWNYIANAAFFRDTVRPFTVNGTNSHRPTGGYRTSPWATSYGPASWRGS